MESATFPADSGEIVTATRVYITIARSRQCPTKQSWVNIARPLTRKQVVCSRCHGPSLTPTDECCHCHCHCHCHTKCQDPTDREYERLRDWQRRTNREMKKWVLRRLVRNCQRGTKQKIVCIHPPATDARAWSSSATQIRARLSVSCLCCRAVHIRVCVRWWLYGGRLLVGLHWYTVIY